MLVVIGAAEMSFDEKDAFVNELLTLTPLPTEQSLVDLTLALNKGNKVIAAKRQRRAAEATRLRDPEASKESAERSQRVREENENLFQEEQEKVRVFVQNHFKPWSRSNLTKMVRTMRAVASIIKLAEPNSMVGEYRLEYSGIFRAVASRQLAVEAVTGAKEEDKPWLVCLFRIQDIVCGTE
jgi:hypothetical protein